MSIKLLTLEYKTELANGWTTEKLKFGKTITEVHGNNITGKTVILKGIIYCFGYPLEIPEDIKKHCTSVSITFEKDNEIFELERNLHEDYKITLRKNGRQDFFFKEADFSSAIFKLLEINRPELTTKGHFPTSIFPYLSNLYPIFWIDQDLGWSNLYRPLKNKDFIKEQREEIIRLILDLPPKNPFINKSQFKDDKINLETTLAEIEVKKRLMKLVYSSNSISDHHQLSSLQEEYTFVKMKLEQISESFTGFELNSPHVLDQIRTLENKLNEYLNQAERLKAKKERLLTEFSDVDAEVLILSDNAYISDMFQSFCGEASCKIFNKASFGKKLLYLKDQKKDIELVISNLNNEISKVMGISSELSININDLRSKVTSEQGLEKLFMLATQLTKQLSEIELKIHKFKEHELLANEFTALLNKKNELEKSIKSHKSSKNPTKNSQSFKEAIVCLNEKINDWLKVLNVEFSSVEVNHKFEVIIDNKMFNEASEESGSERQRIVLAYHAAILETSLCIKGKHPGILIFDGIRQHELNLEDLKNYILKLISLETIYKKNIQFIFSISQEDFDLGNMKNKNTWSPNKLINGKKWFFGPC